MEMQMSKIKASALTILQEKYISIRENRLQSSLSAWNRSGPQLSPKHILAPASCARAPDRRGACRASATPAEMMLIARTYSPVSADDLRMRGRRLMMNWIRPW
eukprot:CAMPEP_0172196622 /NCGR_PEP_ID=MMETSP1050-20130122/26939_1 /TAXON_ID=233186 /ORGANISM="Cryptomonas curvata, Strain CCAP979/52" /LENGTH=102 /DNA_ID=CAMNT_0012872963 /DNA_START=770 /DNA_END=1077 /DNA_ORIENTATION=-